MPQSVLAPPPQPIGLAIFASLFGHGCLTTILLGTTALFATCGSSKAIIDLDKQMEVSMVVLPKSKHNMPDRAARAPAPRGSKPSPKIDRVKPIRQSDLGFETPDAPEDEGFDDRAADDLMEQLKMEELLNNLDAPDGPRDRYATDPNSTSDEAINAVGPGVRGDPEWMRYTSKLERLFHRGFKPIQKDPSLKCVIQITVDARSGRVTSTRVLQGSGNPSFDALSGATAASVTSIPLPPERFLSLLSEGFTVSYVPDA